MTGYFGIFQKEFFCVFILEKLKKILRIDSDNLTEEDLVVFKNQVILFNLDF